MFDVIELGMDRLLASMRKQAWTNADTLIFGYGFWKTVESIAKKRKDAALKDCIKSCGKTPTTTGVVIASKNFKLEVQVNKSSNVFDKTVFIDNIVKSLNIPKHKLNTLLSSSTKKRAGSKIFTMDDNE